MWLMYSQKGGLPPAETALCVDIAHISPLQRRVRFAWFPEVIGNRRLWRQRRSTISFVDRSQLLRPHAGSFQVHVADVVDGFET